jgi:hypothetical protein
LGGRTVPLSKIQIDVLRHLAANRDPESDVAGASPLNRNAPRYSGDETFGFVLHPVDLAMNKVMAAAGRRELRDIVDLVTIHETIMPLGAAIWAAVEKSPGFTPEGLIAEIRRNANHPAAEWRALQSSEPLDPKDITARLRTALAAAESVVARMPTAKMGLLFLKDGEAVQPDPDRLEDYQTDAGSAAANGRAARKSPPPCSSGTTRSQAPDDRHFMPCRSRYR